MNKTVLCIVDGMGYSPNDNGNAVRAADMVNFRTALESNPWAFLKASGPEVGLVDEKDAGNSEVGHNAIGSGQHIKQGLALLNDKFTTTDPRYDIWTSDAWKELSANAAATGRPLHVITLLSNGRVHSDLTHLFALIRKCGKEGMRLAIHALLDGRDVEPQSALKFINLTRAEADRVNSGARIATVAGRGVLFMDRYLTNTKLVADGIDVCALGKAPRVNLIDVAINDEYKKRPDMTDETMPAFRLEDDEWLIKNGDSVLLLNYRGDRAVETCAAFERGKYLTAEQYAAIDKCKFAGILQYDAELGIPKRFLCSPPKIDNVLTEWLCKHKVRQFTVTETVKFGHLTYFFNGNRATPINDKLETWKEIPSGMIDYAATPEMQAAGITDAAIAAIRDKSVSFIKLNLANPDMVGHTGSLAAATKACRTVDECLGRLIDACKTAGVNLIITADHGNAEAMLDENGKPRTSHTNNPVPLIIMPFGTKKPVKVKPGEWGLTNLAATICLLLGIPASPHFNPPIITL